MGTFIGLVNWSQRNILAARPCWRLDLVGLGARLRGHGGVHPTAPVAFDRGDPGGVVRVAGAGGVGVAVAGRGRSCVVDGLVRLHPPFVPLPIVVAVLLALFGHWLFMRTSYGVVLRGIGSTPVSLQRAGWSLLAARSTLFGLAGVFGVIAGLLVTGLNTSGDATIGASYTLLSVAAVIIGGGEFVGGVVSPVGAVIGAFIMLLTGALLSLMNVSTDWQLSVQGAILILVLSTRVLQRRQA